MTIFTESTSGLKESGDGSYKVVLITPGQGSSAYYTEELLKEQGPAAFPAGTHSYLDHPADLQNPKRSPEKLLGVFTEDAHFVDGEGLVSRFKPMKHWRDFIEEVKDYVGMSVFVEGDSEEREVDGKNTIVAESLKPNIVNTVDLVSYAGRGGHFAESLVQAALKNSLEQGTSKEEQEQMALSDEKADALITRIDALIASHEQLTESLAGEADARVVEGEKAGKAVAATLAVESAEISDSMKSALIEEIKSGNYEVDAKIDQFKTIYAEAVEAAKSSFLTEGYGTVITGAPATPTEVEGW